MPDTLFTIGYEKARLADVVAALEEAGIKTLIDVRDRPQSRRPGFSKKQLAAGLEEAGIDYVGLKALGTPPEGREANRKRQWERFWRIVDDRLTTAEAEHALAEAAVIASKTPTCLLCYEADHRICHRSRIASILAARHGFEIRHLGIDGGRSMSGRITAGVAIAGFLWAAVVPADAQPAGSLAANPASGPAPLSVMFTVSPAPSPDSAIDFGDGSAASQLRPAPSCAGCAAVTHVYQTNGRYVARLSSGPNVVGRATISVGQ